MAGLEIKREQTGLRTAVMTLKGRVDETTYASMEQGILGAFDTGFFRLAVDLSGIEHFEDVGAGLLVAAKGEAMQNGGDVVVFNPSASVKKVLAQLGDPLQVESGRDAALRSLGA